MGQKKLIRFAELNTFDNVLQFPTDMAGNWGRYFKNNNEIILELACGKGEYSVALAKIFPNKNFIGVDIKGNRIWVGAKKALQTNQPNVAFLRAQIEQINEYFKPNEVSEIWITFPDPQLRLSKAKKRLTHTKFLRNYQSILKLGGLIHLKTDSPHLYDFTKKIIHLTGSTILADYDDLYSQSNLPEILTIKTYYESLDIAQSNRVHYLCFSLPAEELGAAYDNVIKEMLKNESQH